nr:DNA/RNA nuclease SfsA [Lachnospiraceae bacterium]
MARPKPEIKYSNTVPAIFLQRNNRFTAEVLVGDEQKTVHIKNTGRLEELLVPKAKVTLQKAQDAERKTEYDLISVYRPKFKWINVDSLAPNKLMQQHLEPLYDLVKPEYTYGDSRFDFYMERNGEKYLTEVKGCTLAYEQKSGIGYFPDAPTERGIKHLNELAKAAKEGYHCTIAFVIQMNGIHIVLPNNRTQPEFGRALITAAKVGVEIIYHDCHVEADSIRMTGVTLDTGRYQG